MTDNKKSEPGIVYVGFILGIITAICLILVFGTSYFTKDAIANAKHEAQNARYKNLLNGIPYNNVPDEECYIVNDSNMSVLVARNNNEITAFIVTYDVSGGYSSPFKLIAGVDNATSSLTYIDVVEFNETPGLGDKILRSQGNFLDTFIGKNLKNSIFEVKKYGGDFDYFTGATVTPRAVVRSTKTMLEKLAESDITKLPHCAKQ